MPKTPKEGPDTDKTIIGADDKASWGEDQKNRGYYYDDAHGYEIFEPDDGNDEEDNAAVPDGNTGSNGVSEKLSDN